MITDLLEDFGYESDRFEIAWVSSAEPDRFVAAVSDMTRRVTQLGPVNSERAEAA